MNKTTIITGLLFMLALSATATYAAVVNPLSLSEGTPETRDLTSLPTQSVEAQGGNVTSLNIDALSVTQSWQGYFGNITGTITLDDASNRTFYNWTLTSAQGEVYASIASGADFTTTSCASAAERTSEETYLGQAAADGDSISNTFTNGTHPTFDVSGTTIGVDECFNTNAFSNELNDTSRFHQILLADGSSNIVYTTIMDNDQVSFDNSIADFQILVGEPNSAGSTTYFFFVELS
jgi:hypothetical protein